MLAAGHADLVIETELKPYDILPLVPIIEGSGGVVTTGRTGRRCRWTRRCGGRQTHPRKSHGIAERLTCPKITRSRVQNSGVPGTKASTPPELGAVAILLHQQFVLRPDHDQLRAGAQAASRSLRSRYSTRWSRAAATMRIGWRIRDG